MELSSMPVVGVLPGVDVLRQNIVDKLKELNGLSAERLARVYDFLLQMEMERLCQEIAGGGNDEELSPEFVEAAKLEHRRKHPYGR